MTIILCFNPQEQPPPLGHQPISIEAGDFPDFTRFVPIPVENPFFPGRFGEDSNPNLQHLDTLSSGIINLGAGLENIACQIVLYLGNAQIQGGVQVFFSNFGVASGDFINVIPTQNRQVITLFRTRLTESILLTNETMQPLNATLRWGVAQLIQWV